MAKKEPLDPRSTGRKRARAVVLKEVEAGDRIFECECEDPSHNWHTGKCCWTPDRTKPLGRDNNLDVDHRNKNWLDNDSANLSLLCRRCHRKLDRTTEKGESRVEDEYGILEGY